MSVVSNLLSFLWWVSVTLLFMWFDYKSIIKRRVFYYYGGAVAVLGMVLIFNIFGGKK